MLRWRAMRVRPLSLAQMEALVDTALGAEWLAVFAADLPASYPFNRSA